MKIICLLLCAILLLTVGMVNGIDKTLICASTNIPFFSQHDTNWANDIVGTSGQTIETIGCAMTCVAMILKYYGVDVNPGTLNKWLSSNNGYMPDGTIYWGAAVNFSPSQVTWIDNSGQSTWKFTTPTSADWSILDSELSLGYPVIVQVNNGSHWVVITHKEGSSYYINDPWDSPQNVTKTLGSLGNNFQGMRFLHGTTTTFSPTVISTLKINDGGYYPGAVAVNSSTNLIYVANSGSNNISVIDGLSNTIVTTIGVGINPLSVAVNNITNRIYVSNFGGDCISVINGTSNIVEETIYAGSGPNAVAVNTTTNRLFVINSTNTVSVIDGYTNSVLTTVFLGPTYGVPNQCSIAINPNTNRVYVSNGLTNDIFVIDGLSNTIITAIQLENVSGRLAVNPNTNRIYAVNGARTLSVIDGNNNNIVDIVDMGNTTLMDISINTITNTIYTKLFYWGNSGGRMSVIDGASNSIVANIEGYGGISIAVNPNTNYIYLPNYSTNNVPVLDGLTKVQLTNIQVGNYTRSVAINPNTRRIYVTGWNNTVLAFDEMTNALLSTVGLNEKPEVIAINPKTNKIYVTTDSNDIFIINGSTNVIEDLVNVGSIPGGIAVNQETNRIYVTNPNANTVTVINGLTNTVIATIYIPSGVRFEPSGIAVNPSTNKVYIINGGAAVSVMDGITNTVIGEVHPNFGSFYYHPYGITVNSKTNRILVNFSGFISIIDGESNTIIAETNINGTYLAINSVTDCTFIADPNNNSVSIIDESNTLVANVNVGKGPICLAIDQSTSRVFVANGGDDTLSIIQDDATKNHCPTLTSIEPNSGVQGQTIMGVKFNGSNLTGATNISFSGTEVIASKLSVNTDGTQITAYVTLTSNAEVGTRDVTVTTSEGTSEALIGGFTVVGMVNKLPILLVHGFMDKPDSFSTLKDFLVENGYSSSMIFEVDYCDGGGLNTLQSVNVLAGKLKNYVDSAFSKTPEVDIVAHSMGGLVVRYYLNQGGSSHTKIRKFIMIGTPNQGSGLLTLVNDLSNPSLATLENLLRLGGDHGKKLSEYIKSFQVSNSLECSVKDMTPGSRFLTDLGTRGLDHNIGGAMETYAISGNNETWNDAQFGIVPWGQYYKTIVAPWMNGPDDGVVTITSVEVGNIHPQIYNATHNNIGGDELDELKNSMILSRVQNLLSSSVSDTLTEFSKINFSSDASNENQCLFSDSEMLTPFESKSLIIPIDFVSEANFFITWNGGLLGNISLVSPSGQIIDNNANEPDKKCLDYYDSVNFSGIQQYQLSNPQPGNWFIELQSDNSEDVSYTVMVMATTDLSLSISSDRFSYNNGDSVYLTCSLVDNCCPVLSAMVNAKIHRPDNVTEFITLFDDGQHNDSADNDGIYGANYTDTYQIGTYHISAIAKGIDGSFNRESTSVSIWVEQYPDLTLSSSDISFSNTNPLAGENITITSIIHNRGDINAENATIYFYDGDPTTGIPIGEATNDVPSGGMTDISVPWTASTGSHEIHILVSPYNTFVESDYTNNEAFTYINVILPLPTIYSILPSTGPTVGGTTVTITGTGFASDNTTVSIGGFAATNIIVSDNTTITATTPAGITGARDVVVTTPGGSATLTGGFTYLGAPTVATISPSTGPTVGGTTVTIIGTGFASDNTTVSIGGFAATNIIVSDNTTITATTPAGIAGARDVVVTTPGGSATLTGGFTYVAPNTSGGGGGGGSSSTGVKLSGFLGNTFLSTNSSGVLNSAVKLKTADGALTLDVAKGTKLQTSSNSALTSLGVTHLTSTPQAPDGSALILAYSFSPNGAKFDPALSLTFSYDPGSLPYGLSENDLYIAFFDGTKWQKFESTVDTSANTVTAKVTHFSSYALLGSVVTITPTPTTSLTPNISSSPSPTATQTPTPKLAPTVNPTPTTAVTTTNIENTPITSKITAELPTSPVPSKASTPWVVIIVVIVCLVAILAIVMIVIRGRKVKK